MRIAVAAIILLAAGRTAMAQDAQGVYVGPNGLTVTVFPTEGAAPFAGRFTTGTPGDPQKCGGEFAATGEKIGSEKLEFRGAPEGGKTCVITMTFARGLSAAVLDEDGCTNYHGAACDFVGAVQRQSH